MSASMLDRPWEAALDAVVEQGVRWVEACGGGHIPTRHLDPVALADDRAALERFRQTVFPGLEGAYRRQWEDCVLPYWRRAAAHAADAGVVLCVEPHPADVVYNTETFMRLRAEVGPSIGMNFDPSHLWWQGIDPLAVVEAVGADIRTCHVKDLQLHPSRIRRDGVLSSAPYERWDERPWTFSTPGYGHAELFWARLVTALRRAGYDGLLSIECEDPFMTPDDTFARSVALLRRVLPEQAPPGVDWASEAAFTDQPHAPQE
jgi:sugar phosphate isomerase/epimerase